MPWGFQAQNAYKYHTTLPLNLQPLLPPNTHSFSSSPLTILRLISLLLTHSLPSLMAAESELKMSHDQVIPSTNKSSFDPSAPPPFTISQIRAAIPSHCWVKNPWKSFSYVLRDVFIVFTLLALALHFDSWLFWPLYWPLQGTMFWAIFVLGHDWYILSFILYVHFPLLCYLFWSLIITLVLLFFSCSGHGSFSDSRLLNNFVGHILHSSILVPYHGWLVLYQKVINFNFLLFSCFFFLFKSNIMRMSSLL